MDVAVAVDEGGKEDVSVDATMSCQYQGSNLDLDPALPTLTVDTARHASSLPWFRW